MARTGIGVDVGSRTSIALKGVWKGGTFHLSGASFGENPTGDLQAGWAALSPHFKLNRARVGISGRDVNVRYTRVPEVPDWQLRNLMRFEVQEIGDQSGAEVASDFNLLPRPPEVAGEDVVLLAMGRESLLEQHAEGIAATGGSLDAFTPCSVALYTAYLRYALVQDDTVLLANIGHESTDVCLVRGADLVFARNLSGGAGLLDEAIMSRLGVDPVRAEDIKIDHVDLTPGRAPAGSEAEKATRAVMGAAGQLMSLLQSAVMFAKNQVKLPGLKVDRVLICGGGAGIEGLPEYLSSGMGVPVERFDAFRVVDTSALSAEEVQALEDHELEAVVALGLATTSSDPDAYSLEIVPEALERRRQFFGGTLWMIGAAVLAVGILGLRYQAGTKAAAQLEERASRMSAVASRAKRVHTEAERLVQENEVLSAQAAELQTVAGSGEQLARVLALMDRHLPSDFWITEVKSLVGRDDALGVTRDAPRPVLRIEGRAREGVQSPTAQWQELVTILEDALPDATFNPTFDKDTFTLTMTMFKEVSPSEIATSDDALEGA